MNDKRLGVMVDCSRNGVMNVTTVKRFIDTIKKMGYNMLMLYTEDTYEVDNQPRFGYLRGRYSKEEMKEIAAYGEEQGVELIPCIQTLAHLNQYLRWSEVAAVKDVNDILLIDEPKTYELIEDMFSTLRQCFKTNKIHIGMDEAHMVGLGKFLDKNGFQNRFEILSRHLHRVAELAKKYDFEPMMWSDMFFRLANNGNYYVGDPNIITDEIVKCVPDNVELVFWNYYDKNEKAYSNMLEAHKRFNKPIWFAGGVWTWTGFTPHNKVSEAVTKPAVDACREANVENVFFTSWGDNGAETSTFAVLPALFYAAELYRGNDDKELIKQRFEELFGIAYDDFCKLDLPAGVGPNGIDCADCPDKMMLYKDPFLGYYDALITDGRAEAEEYSKIAEQLKPFADNPEYGHLFKSAAALCEVLSVKVDLGLRTRAAYKSGDKEALKQLIEDYKLCAEKIEAFHLAFRSSWMKEKKPHGFDVQDIRLGGLLKRLESCRQRIEGYLSGEFDSIPELCEELLPYPENHRRNRNSYSFTATVNML